jgi:hypothetical protein
MKTIPKIYSMFLTYYGKGIVLFIHPILIKKNYNIWSEILFLNYLLSIHHKFINTKYKLS